MTQEKNTRKLGRVLEMPVRPVITQAMLGEFAALDAIADPCDARRIELRIVIEQALRDGLCFEPGPFRVQAPCELAVFMDPHWCCNRGPKST
jgi:hypothetical protein